MQNVLIFPDPQGAVRLRHDTVGAACIETGHDAPLLILSKGELGLIAVAVGILHAKYRIHRWLREAAQALQVLPYLFFFI